MTFEALEEWLRTRVLNSLPRLGCFSFEQTRVPQRHLPQMLL